jgi:hypothetical protein
VILGFELRVSYFLGRFSTTSAQKQLLEVISEVFGVIGYEFNVQKSTVSIYTRKRTTENSNFKIKYEILRDKS